MTAFHNISAYFSDVDNYFDISGIVLSISVIVVTYITSKSSNANTDVSLENDTL